MPVHSFNPVSRLSPSNRRQSTTLPSNVRTDDAIFQGLAVVCEHQLIRLVILNQKNFRQEYSGHQCSRTLSTKLPPSRDSSMTWTTYAATTDRMTQIRDNEAI